MTKEFNLSDKITDTDIGEAIHPDDVKEFIKRLKEEVLSFDIGNGYIPSISFSKRLNKLAGEKLTK